MHESRRGAMFKSFMISDTLRSFWMPKTTYFFRVISMSRLTLYAYLRWRSTSGSPASLIKVRHNTFTFSLSLYISESLSMLCRNAAVIQRWGRWSTGGSIDPLKSLQSLHAHQRYLTSLQMVTFACQSLLNTLKAESSNEASMGATAYSADEALECSTSMQI